MEGKKEETHMGSHLFPSTFTVSVTPTSGGTTLRAIAFAPGMSDSDVHEATYTYIGGNGANLMNTESIQSGITPGYDANGNLIAYKNWSFTYDAQNRLTSASNGTTSAEFYYDGKNRQIARRIGGVVRFSAWDNWELVEEYAGGLQRTEGYLQGATGVIKTLVTNRYYYQDKLGSTTHVTNASGALLESYRYDLYGTPSYFNSAAQPVNSSTIGIVDLYGGERWIPELGLYDLRNRFMSPELGRFLQPDPIGFKGDASNLYRYCGNDPVDRSDPTGLYSVDAALSSLTSMGGGDWVKGSEGLSAWDYAHGMGSNHPQAGMDNGGGGAPDGGGSKSVSRESEGKKMRFVPVKLFDDKKTAKPSAGGDKSGDFYDYQLRDSANHPVSGVGYTVQEKLELVPGVPNNHEVTKKDEKPRALGTRGIYHDYVGHWTRPSSEFNGYTSKVYQTFQLKYNGSPVEVSTRLIHDVRVINGEVVSKVYIDRP